MKKILVITYIILFALSCGNKLEHKSQEKDKVEKYFLANIEEINKVVKNKESSFSVDQTEFLYVYSLLSQDSQITTSNYTGEIDNIKQIDIEKIKSWFVLNKSKISWDQHIAPALKFVSNPSMYSDPITLDSFLNITKIK